MTDRTMELPLVEIPAARLFSPRSHLVDHTVADCEEILLPARPVGGGTLHITLEPGVSAPEGQSRKNTLLRRVGLKDTTPLMIDGPVLIDLRLRLPDNWAHFLTNHLPITFAICAELGLARSEVTLVLPAAIPGYTLACADLFGFAHVETDRPVRGRLARFEVTPWIGIRGARVGWARSPLALAALKDAGLGMPSGEVPARIFLSRKDSRRLTNEAEIRTLLEARGFKTLYAEEHSAEGQLRLLREAHEIVAIHGAAVAPLIYRNPKAPRAKLVEIFPCTKMTNVWRAMGHLVGCDWSGVRGKIEPAHLKGLYDLSTPYFSDGDADFEADPVSLERALAAIGAGG